MAERVREATDDAPPIDPEAVPRAYRRERARRRARIKHRRATKWASVRFWVVLLTLLAASIFLMLTLLREVERLFGL
jgi:hypothetical protein